MNYSDHAAQSGFKVPDSLPPIFTKFVSILTGPEATVALPKGGNVDWEVELVVVIGRAAKDVSEEDAWTFVAGLSVGAIPRVGLHPRRTTSRHVQRAPGSLVE